MTQEPDLVDEYLRLVLDGAKHTDTRFDDLLARMTPEEFQQTRELVIDVLRRQLAPADFVDLYFDAIAHGAQPNDLSLVTLLDVMSPDELERGKQAIGELWLRTEPIPAKPN